MAKKLLMVLFAGVFAGCAADPDPIDERIETAIKLCQSDSAKAYSNTVDGLRVMCHSGSSYIIRGDITTDDLEEYDRVYCSSMGIREFESQEDGSITLRCIDGASFIL